MEPEIDVIQQNNYVWMFVSVILIIFTVCYIFSYVGISTKYYYIVIINYALLFAYFYYKYTRYRIIAQ